MLVIFTNVLTLGVYDYKDRNMNTAWNQLLFQISKGFTVCYSIECFFKIIAQGFVWGDKVYLKNGWNILDACIVFFG
jgi:hypothetical protein